MLRMSHLHTAAHAAFKICPQLASFYGGEFLAALGGQRMSNEVLRKLCIHCGALLVDGRTVARVSVVSSAQTRQRRRAGKVAGGSARRVVRARPNETRAVNNRAPPTRDERLAQLQDQRNTVEYMCSMCATRIVYPGSTRTGLRAAGLDTGARQAATPAPASAPAMVGTRLPVAHAVPGTRGLADQVAETGAAAAPPGSAVRASHGVRQESPLPSQGGRAVAAAEAAVPDLAAKKRKRHKSNLLAAVAANKKKVEDKRSAGSSAFNLSDFLSSL
ncbi:hypothetical protein LPJ61_001626 [Coemansia biformis]|uniref:Rpr2-domain-containing protein n=1 Tax=Coemansia biformis TaxID=1286918 RepID=A0A9W7YFL3_9FUNG|nr:hypothetical protein LPJ61_001626 [Coemansia biformis]